MAKLFGNAVAGPITPHANQLGNKAQWFWQISGEKAVTILRRIRPWLSERYQERADAAIAHHESFPKGRKLTPVQVEAIKERLRTGAHGIGNQLAREYGVTDGLISAIKHGRR